MSTTPDLHNETDGRSMDTMDIENDQKAKAHPTLRTCK